MILALLLAAQAQVVAVLEFRDKVPADQHIDTAYLSDQVRSAVKERLPAAKVITRENMLVMLQASGKDLAECEGECEVDTGRRIGADLVVSGELLLFGTQYKLNLKLHDTRSGELLSGVVATGPTADDLDHDLKPTVDKLLLPILRKGPAPETKRRDTAVAAWLVAAYQTWAQPPVNTSSGLGWYLGADVFVRVVGPFYLGALLDYSFSNRIMVGGGLRIALGRIALSGVFGYADQHSACACNGVGAVVAADLGTLAGFTVRAQGSWRHASYIGKIEAGGLAEMISNSFSLGGGLALNF